MPDINDISLKKLLQAVYKRNSCPCDIFNQLETKPF